MSTPSSQRNPSPSAADVRLLDASCQTPPHRGLIPPAPMDHRPRPLLKKIFGHQTLLQRLRFRGTSPQKSRAEEPEHTPPKFGASKSKDETVDKQRGNAPYRLNDHGTQDKPIERQRESVSIHQTFKDLNKALSESTAASPVPTRVIGQARYQAYLASLAKKRGPSAELTDTSIKAIRASTSTTPQQTAQKASHPSAQVAITTVSEMQIDTDNANPSAITVTPTLVMIPSAALSIPGVPMVQLPSFEPLVPYQELLAFRKLRCAIMIDDELETFPAIKETGDGMYWRSTNEGKTGKQGKDPKKNQAESFNVLPKVAY
ncbi:hypothetical protein MMC28_000026 [Mycoblastus sanguinarius]|nr:hypothetical protein [Mycoblastus sanguinarius]